MLRLGSAVFQMKGSSSPASPLRCASSNNRTETVMVQTAEPLVTETTVISGNRTGARFHLNTRVLRCVEPAVQLSPQNPPNGSHGVEQFPKNLCPLQMIWNVLASDCASSLFCTDCAPLVKHSDSNIPRSGGVTDTETGPHHFPRLLSVSASLKGET